MAVQVTNTLTAVITSQEDSTGNVFLNRGTGNPAVDSTTGLFIEQFKTGAANVDTAIPSLSGAPGVLDQLYIKNNDNTAIITVKWTPSGGGSGLVKLAPGSQLLIWETITGNGVSSVTVASNVGATFVEIFMGVI